MPYVVSTCPFCGCGCGLYLEVADHRLVGVSASPSHPVARGKLCVKGWHAHEMAAAPNRLHRPLVRQGDALAEASWDEALGLASDRLAGIRDQHGPGAVGILGSPRGTNEESFLLSRLARGVLGTNNVDFSDRLVALPGLFDLARCRSLTMSGVGLDALDAADLILLWETDPTHEHPAVASRIMEAAERGASVIAVATLSGQLTGLAHMGLSPRPGTGVELAAGLLHVLLSTFTRRPDELEALDASVSDFTPEQVAAVTGVPADGIRQAGQRMGAATKPLLIYTRAATLDRRAFHLLTALAALGQVASRRAPSWSSLLWLAPFCNFQGARDMGLVPYFLSGCQPVSDAAVREKFGRRWGAEMPLEPGLPAWDMLGAVKGLFVVGDDPLRALPDAAETRRALDALEFLAVQDTHLSATAERADVVLPSASFAEKDGIFTSTERRVQRVRRATAPPGEARSDWEVICELAGRMGRPFTYRSPAEVMDEIAALTPVYSGISYSALEEGWGLCLPPADPGEAERPQTLATNDEPTSEAKHAALTDERFPLLLLPDYVLGAWSADPGVVCSVALRRELQAGRRAHSPVVEISPADARAGGLRDGQQVRVCSRTGEMEAAVHINAGVPPGVLALPFAMRESAAQAMPPTVHPETRVPLLSPCAVRIEKL